MTEPAPDPLLDTRVLIVAEDALARAGLAALLKGQPAALDIVGQIAPDARLVETVNIYQPHTLLWDLGWEVGTALDRLSEWREALPPVVVLIRNVEVAGDAWGAGARGILQRDILA